jgi:hypothetical protein
MINFVPLNSVEAENGNDSSKISTNKALTFYFHDSTQAGNGYRARNNLPLLTEKASVFHFYSYIEHSI